MTVQQTPKERLTLILWLMKRATQSRIQYLIHRNELNERFIKENVKFDDATALPKTHRTIYEATHIEYIFSGIQAVETLEGVLHTAYQLTHEKEKNMEKVIRLILNPDKKQRKIRKKFRDLLTDDEISDDVICDMMALPQLDSFSNSDQSTLQRILKPTFLVSRRLIQFSQSYNDMFRIIRNVFAHNYRFLFFDEISTKVQPQTEQSIVSFLKHDDLSKGYNILLDPFQRAACYWLALQLAELERWVLENIRNYVLNDLRPILPEFPKYIVNDNDLEEYKRIRLVQQYDLDKIPNWVEVEGNVSSQRGLHWEFLGYIKKAIFPDLRFITPDGQELKVHFDRQ